MWSGLPLICEHPFAMPLAASIRRSTARSVRCSRVRNWAFGSRRGGTLMSSLNEIDDAGADAGRLLTVFKVALCFLNEFATV